MFPNLTPIVAVSYVASASAENSFYAGSADEVLANDTSDSTPDSTAEDSAEAEISRLLAAGEAQTLAKDDAAAVKSFSQALSLIDSLTTVDPLIRGEALRGLGNAYAYLQENETAIPLLEKALAIYTSLAEAEGEAEPAYVDIRIDLFGILGALYHDRASYGTALKYDQSALRLAEASDRIEEQAFLQSNIGSIEADIGEYEQAEVSLKQAAELAEQIENAGLVASTTFALGWVAERQEDYEGAIAHYQTAISLYETLSQPGATSDPVQQKNIISREIRAINNLGMVHLNQRDLAAAKAAFERGFALLAIEDDPLERSILVNSQGSLDQASGDFEQAWKAYLEALRLAEKTDNQVGKIEALLNFGRLMEAQEKPNLAIFFYKQAIAQIETIRQDLQQLSQSIQQRYTLTVEDFYRNLADLLLQQNREAEALQVLELLKLQEVKAYLHSDQAEGREETFNTRSEASLLTAFDALLLENSEISLADFLASAEAIAVTDQNRSSGLEPDSLSNTPFNLQAIESLKTALAVQPARTAVLYPLILEDRLEILLLTPEGTVERFKTQVSKAELSSTVEDFQKSLKSEVLDAKPFAQQLYKWLIQPLDETLAAHHVENIIYLPDGVLRYVPLAAFYDGEHWLVEKYQSHNITAASVGDLTKQNWLPLSVVAGAFTDSSLTYQVQVGADTFQYSGLSAAQQEIDRLESLLPNTLALLNGNFTPERTLGAAGNHRIVHLATHANFVPGQPEESFILFGDGQTVNIQQLKAWSLPDVDLVVLSACETASSVEGEGKEILGLGFQIQQAGAGAAIASLWSVNDSSTAALMSQFYIGLSKGQTKAQALRQAQLELIKSDGFSNPNDWGAFILIGNGL